MPRSRQGAGRLHCNIYLTGNDCNFIPAIIGRQGLNISPISEVTKSKIRVRGRGSNHKETNGQVAEVPLMISISTASTDEANFAEAVSQVLRLLEGTCSNITYQAPPRGYYFAPMTETARKVLLKSNPQSVQGMRLPVFDRPNPHLAPLVPGLVKAHSESTDPMRVETSLVVWSSVA
jgi:hypothetical protein